VKKKTITTFRKACLQSNPFLFIDPEGNKEVYRIKHGELEQFSIEDGNVWLGTFIPCTQWLMGVCVKKVEIFDKDECVLCKIYNKPNKETLQALRDSRSGKNLIECKSIKELFKECWK